MQTDVPVKVLIPVIQRCVCVPSPRLSFGISR